MTERLEAITPLEKAAVEWARAYAKDRVYSIEQRWADFWRAVESYLPESYQGVVDNIVAAAVESAEEHGTVCRDPKEVK